MIHDPLTTLFLRDDQTLPTRTLRLHARLSVHGIAMLELVRKTAVGEGVAAVFGDLDFARNEYCSKRFFDNGPEDGHRGAHDREVDFEAGEDDADGDPPGEIDVGIGRCAIVDDGVEAPDGGEDDAVEVRNIFFGTRSLLEKLLVGCS